MDGMVASGLIPASADGSTAVMPSTPPACIGTVDEVTVADTLCDGRKRQTMRGGDRRDQCDTTRRGPKVTDAVGGAERSCAVDEACALEF
eukprot:4008039-Pleurochrysis_carterae.AAC.2